MPRWPDPPAGLAEERTALAWQRSGLAFALIAALLLHAAGGGARLLFAGAAVVYVAAAVGTWRAGGLLYRLRRDGRAHGAARPLRLVTLATIGAALLAAVVAVTR